MTSVESMDAVESEDKNLKDKQQNDCDSNPEPEKLPNGSKPPDDCVKLNGEAGDGNNSEEEDPENSHSNGADNQEKPQDMEVDDSQSSAGEVVKSPEGSTQGDSKDSRDKEESSKDSEGKEEMSEDSKINEKSEDSEILEEKLEDSETVEEKSENSKIEEEMSEEDFKIKEENCKDSKIEKENLENSKLEGEEEDSKIEDEKSGEDTKIEEKSGEDSKMEEEMSGEDSKIEEKSGEDSKLEQEKSGEDSKIEEEKSKGIKIEEENSNIEGEKSDGTKSKGKGEESSGDDSNESNESEKVVKNEENTEIKQEEGVQTIVVTEARSLAQVINKAVGEDSGQNANKPTLVIIDTAKRSEVVKVSTPPQPQIKSEPKPTAVTAVANSPSGAAKSPYPQSTNTQQPQQPTLQDVLTLLPADGGVLLEAPSLVVPYIVERTAKDDLIVKVKELKKLVERENPASTDSANNSADAEDAKVGDNAAALKGKGGLAQNLTERWNAYFGGPVGKFLSEIGMNQVSEWIHHDIARSSNKKNQVQAEKLSKVLKSLEHIKEKNQAFHFKLRKCRFCNFKTESEMVIEHHLQEPHTWNGFYKCNFCKYDSKSMYEVLNHMLLIHKIPGRAVPPVLIHQCSLCLFEDTSKGKLTKHSFKCQKNFQPIKNQAPPPEFDPPAKRIRIQIVPPPRTVQPNFAAQLAAQQRARMRLPGSGTMNVRAPGVAGRGRYPAIQPQMYAGAFQGQQSLILPGMNQAPIMVNQFGGSGQFLYPVVGSVRAAGGYQTSPRVGGPTPVALIQSGGGAKPFVLTSVGAGSSPQSSNSGIPASLHQLSMKSSISITPVTKPATPTQNKQTAGAAAAGNKNSNFVICEICDGYIKDLEALRNHMQWIHKVKIHPRMIYNRPPLNCQKCQCRFFTDQGLERHLLGTHGLVTSSMQESANKGRDGGRCTNCGKVFQWKLLAHMSKDHGMTLKPAHLSYKCTVCSATFGMYRLFEEHVYTAHSNVAKKMLEGPEKKKAAPATTAAPQTPKSTPAVTITAKPAATGTKTTPSSSKSATIDPTLSVGKVTDLKCLECGMIFQRPANYFKHWESVHLKSCEVKTCKVDKCKDCHEKFKLGEDVVCTHLDPKHEEGMEPEEGETEESRKRKPDSARKPCPRSKRQKTDELEETGNSKKAGKSKKDSDENGSDAAFDNDVESPGQIGVASDED